MFRKSLLVVMTVFLMLPTLVLGQEGGSSQPYGIQVLKHNLQDQSGAGYISLNNNSRNESIKNLGFNIRNKSETSITVEIKAQNMYSLVYNYKWDTQKAENYRLIDERYELKNYIENLEQEVVLMPGEQKQVLFDIKDVPKDLNGQIFGSIVFSEKKTMDGKENSLATITKQQVGLIIHQDHDDEREEIEVKEAGISTVDGFSYYVHTVTNNNPYIISDEINIKILDKEGTTMTEQKQSVQMSPKSTFMNQIPLELVNKDQVFAFPEGTYSIQIKGEMINFTDTFVIKNIGEANEIEDAEKPNTYEFETNNEVPTWVWIVIGSLVILVLVLILILVRKKKDKEGKED